MSTTVHDDESRNILGKPLQAASFSPLTGFYRDGYCRTGALDAGAHVVCAVLTQPFLDYSKAQGNDLVTPRPEFGFPGLRAGDRWCVCASRWLEAYDAGVAPQVVLAATHERALNTIPLDALKEKAFSEPEHE
jgi:uncharacterized protein (DUF2237 family)